MKNVMNKTKLALGIIAAVGMVTAAHYFWHFIRSNHPRLVFPIFCLSVTLLALAGYFFLDRACRRSYERHRRLSDLTLFLACSAWGLFFALPSLYGPYNWAWSLTNEVHVPGAVILLSGLLVAAGMTGLIVAFVYLGVLRSIGQDRELLRTTGPYRLTRNPQFTAGALVVLGMAILRPSWFAAGWAALFVFLARVMVGAEEEHLKRIFGKEYERYSARTPKFVGMVRDG